MSKFPTYLKSNNTGEVGVNLVSQVVNDEMSLIFKRNGAEFDFGIDAYIEIVTDEGAVTGQLIGVQIKCGKSFFKQTTKTGFTFYGENKHLNYYCNAPFPVIIIIVDPESKACYWQHFSLDKTEQTKTSWKINIPRRNKLSKNSKIELMSLVGKPQDYSDEAKKEWELTKQLKNTEYVHYAVPREYIEARNYKPLKQFIDRIVNNDELAINLQGKIEITVSGYHDDKRELWEIKAVRKWVKKAEPKIKYWFYFCSNKHKTETLTWVLGCLTNTTTEYVEPGVSNRINIHYETKPLAEIIARNFSALNELTDRYGLSEEENIRITSEAMLSVGLNT
ncbi:DUF4365 and DUF1817 domain-containing protein [Vibrio cholerae]|uniref:DUF4365 domain-containing protein n=1 Tax=Vibrio cholerae TaxID=666 RepID=UPI00115C3831|nr:DUF4365 and DUF1817 domain-containing protein [Vibrio cholerae]TQP19942.1 DUF4365 and DUF1817 domain-containing protein [Vibrio cholerae]